MESVLMIGFCVGGLFLGIGIGIKIGKYYERRDWNKLIDEGYIRKPNVKKR